jgi:hypothetical protein
MIRDGEDFIGSLRKREEAILIAGEVRRISSKKRKII